jgi:uncharacterized protein DUF3592
MKRTKAILGGLLALAAGGFLIFLGVKEYRTSKRLVNEGKTAVAKVTDKDVSVGRKGRRSYYVSVEFKAESGQEVDERLRVSSSEYDAAAVGGTVPVQYLAEDPSTCQIGNQAKVKWTTFAIGAFLAAAGGFGMFRGGSEESHEAENPEQQVTDTADPSTSTSLACNSDSSSSEDFGSDDAEAA